MNGQLWQECYCGDEPCCADCEQCERHCSCSRAKSDAQQIREFERASPGFLERHARHMEDGANEH